MIMKLVIRGADGSWHYGGGGCTAGKQAHIASAVEELNMISKKIGSQSPYASVTRASTLLIDDDPANVAAALTNGRRRDVTMLRSLCLSLSCEKYS